MDAKSNAPIIIKRKKVVAGDGHHGGAWKVAYADFVTAMMAFFMLMWLLNATTEKQRKGIADYFNPTIPINRISGGGDGSFGGDSVFSEQVLPQNGLGATTRRATAQNQASGRSGVDISAEERAQADAETRAMTDLAEMLQARSGESMASDGLLKHIVTEVTDQGLIVNLVDSEGAPLFDDATDTPQPVLRELVAIVAQVFMLAQNPVAVEGHVRAAPLVRMNADAWGRSIARARQTSALMDASGFPARKVARVTGHADRDPAARDPMALRNNRVQLILLRKQGGQSTSNFTY